MLWTYGGEIICASGVDGGMLLARSFAEARDMIGVVVEVAGRCGLHIITRKSNVLLYNHKGIISEMMGGISVVNSLR